MHTRKWIGNKTSVWAALMAAALLLVLLVNAQHTQAALIANKAQNGGLETGTTTGWSAVGSAVISATYLPAHEGSYSLHVDARTAPEDGAKQSLTSALTNGKTYAISAWVKLGAGESPAEIRMRLLKTANGNTTEQLQASATGSDGQWVKLEGSYTLNAPGALPALDLIFYAGNGTADFYIDSLRIVEQLTGIYNPLNTANVTALNADTVRLLTTNDGLALNMNTLREADQWQVESAGGNYTYNQNAQYGNRVSRPAVAGSEAWTNYKLSARMKPTATSTFASFALTARAGANGSLQAKYDFAQKKLSIFRFYNGVGYELASKTYTINLNQTATFEFSLNGSQISLSVDGTPQLSAQDNFVVSGGIALTAFSTTMTFDNIQVVDLGTNSTLFSDNFEDGDSAGWTVASSVPQLFQQLNDWYNAGIPVIFSLTWTRSGKGYIPEGQERVDALQLVDDFLADWGSKIAVFVVENEPMFGYVTPGHKSVNAQGNIPAIEWFKALAAQAQATKAQHSGLSGLLVSSGSVDWALERKHNELDAVNTQFFDAEIDWINSDSHIDMVDLHLHVADLAEMNETIDYLKQRTGKPLISTEWSQAHLLKPWLTQTINSGFAAAWGVNPTLTNEQYVKLLLATPASKAEWDAFVATSPIHESFLQEASTALLERGMVATTYGAAKQYGAVMYDMKQLYATMTVQLDTYGQYQENGTYAQTFAGLDTTLPTKPFSEDFEYGLGQWAVDYGSPTISRSVAHTGSGSLLINEDQEQVSHTWDAMNQKALSIWFYDDASDTSSRVRVHAGSTTNGYLASLGVDTPTSSTKYAYQLYTGSLNWKATTVTRTTGWHHLVFDYSGGAGVTLYMDGVQVAQSSAHQAFNKIMIGDTSIGTTSTAYFDDIEIIDP